MTNLKHYTSTTLVPMTTKLCSMVTYLEGLLPLKPHDPLIRWSRNITWQTKTIIFAWPQCMWPPNLAGWWLASKDSFTLSLISSMSRGIGWSRDKLKTLNYEKLNYKLGMVVTNNEGLQPIKSYDPSIMCSCEVTRHFKYVISPLPLG